jgi:hypothetical protein
LNVRFVVVVAGVSATRDFADWLSDTFNDTAP